MAYEDAIVIGYVFTAIALFYLASKLKEDDQPLPVLSILLIILGVATLGGSMTIMRALGEVNMFTEAENTLGIFEAVFIYLMWIVVFFFVLTALITWLVAMGKLGKGQGVKLE